MSRGARHRGAYRLALLGLLALGWPASGGSLAAAAGRPGILLMAHGGDRAWNQQVLAAVEPLRRRWPVSVAFGMAQRPALERAVRDLEGRGVGRIAVVRLFISADSFLEQTEYLLGLRAQPPDPYLEHSHGGGPEAVKSLPPEMAPPPIPVSVPLALSRQGLDQSPAMGRVIAERLRALSREPERESVLILAHGDDGNTRNQVWIKRMHSLLQAALGDLSGFRAFRIETLREDWPAQRRLAERRIRSYVAGAARDGGSAIVVPFRLFGFGPYAKVLRGLSYRSDGRGLLPHPAVTRWIEEQALECLKHIPQLPPSALARTRR